jgi:hypothetical protein
VTPYVPLQKGKWVSIAGGSSVGQKRAEVFEPIETASLRLKITDSIPLPHIESFAAYGRN